MFQIGTSKFSLVWSDHLTNVQMLQYLAIRLFEIIIF